MHTPAAESNTRSRFAAERSPILNEIDVHLRKALELKTRLNTFTDINQLPTKLLAKILVAYARDHYQSATRQYDSPHWIRLAHVCRHWHDVALETPRFWSYVCVRRPKTLSALLPLSKSSPLHIDIDLPVYRYDSSDTLPSWVSTTDLIGQESHRLRELCWDSKLSEVRMLAEKLNHPMPLLQKLVLSGRVYLYQEGDIPQPFHLLPTPAHPARLRHLELRHFPFTWTDPIFCSALTTLVLTRKAHWHAIGTFDQLLDALQAIAPTLVHLKLEEAVPWLQSSTTEPPFASGRSIVLSSLQTLSVTCNTNDCTHLMDHLSVNPAATMKIKGSGGTGIARLTEILSAHYSRSTPLLALSIVLDPLRAEVTIVGNNSDKMFEHVKGPDTIRLSFSHDERGTGQGLLAAVLAVSTANTPFSRVRTLHLNTDSRDGFHMNWSTLFAHMPSVEVLDILRHPGEGFFEALSDVQEASVEQGQSPGTFVPLNQLCRLKLEDLHLQCESPTYLCRDDGKVEVFDQLLDWTILRCNYGVPLERLELSACKHLTAKRVESIEEVIAEVDWDGWERESTDEDDSDSV